MDPLSLLTEEEKSQAPTKKSESLDDFEHVLNNVASPANDLSDLTKFINFEKGQFETEGAIKEAQQKGGFGSDFGSVGDPLGSSKNFMQYDQSGTNDKNDFDDFLKGESKVDDDSDQSQGDDDSIVSPPPVVKAPTPAKPLTPEPVKAPTPEPAKPITPELVKAPTPEPIKAPTPEPAKPKTPEPTKAPTPELVKAPTPEPAKPKTPEPVKAPTPEPVKAPTPEPIKAKTPEPAKAPSPEPVKTQPKVPAHKGYESDEEVAPPAPVPRDYPEIGVIEPKDILAACGLYSLFRPERLNPKVEALVYWRDPKQSGIVFGSVLVVLLSLTVCSLISVVAYTSLLVLVAAISFRTYKSILQAVQKTSEGHPFNKLLPVLQNPLVSAVFQSIEEYLDVDLTLSPERVREVTDTAVTHINGAITELRRRFLVEDIVDSIKFGLLLYVLTYLGSWFNGLTLIILAYVALFTLPKVYENNQQQIDANLDLVRAKINEVTDKVKAIIPIGKKEEAKNKSE